jgi:hypothetical protein
MLCLVRRGLAQCDDLIPSQYAARVECYVRQRANGTTAAGAAAGQMLTAGAAVPRVIPHSPDPALPTPHSALRTSSLPLPRLSD